MITDLFRYPVKGLSGERCEHVHLSVEDGLAGDRAIAIARDPTVFDPAAPKASSKLNFLMLAKDERLARLEARFDEDRQTLTLFEAGARRVEASVADQEGRATLAAFFQHYLGDETLAPTIVKAPGHKFTDVSVVSEEKMRAISLINLASVRALEEAIGRPVDRRRFRGNVYFDGAPAWAEFDWVGSTILIGGAAAEVVMRTKRCPATQVNPETAERDINVPAELRRHFNHFDMGVYAEVRESGEVAIGDAVIPLSHGWRAPPPGGKDPGMSDKSAILATLRADQDETAAAQHGVNAEEWERLVSRLGRAPNLVELGIYSVMWSEHCSYKSSRRHLAKFPTKNARVIQGPGENAGVVDIGDGQAAIFKMESHNHPSYIEPYQGAATGVGGILRDVFTMGARPIALVNALRFGDPDHPKTRSLVAGVVAGIGGYGNCVGVPTVAGETQFDQGYNGNILVNAMAVGLADQDKIFYARGAEPGNPIFYVGSKTGRDGIHGATMASAEFSKGDEEKRPTVQVGDPFTEKLLIEACLELMATDAIQAIQDMGAAGLTSSSVEMADKGGVGIELDLDKVPQRETGMTAYEIMLSESQERMLMVLKPGKVDVAKAIFEKYDLDAEVIGETTDTGRLALTQFGETVCDIPVAPLAEDAPNYDRSWVEPKPRTPLDPASLPEPEDYGEVLLKLMSSPDMASKRWIWEQYDRHVMGDTIDSSQSMGDAAIVRIHGTNKALAITSDCNPHYVAADPYEGGKAAVAEAYRNLSAVGAQPIAITDNLNFGNPERPQVMGQIVKAIEGMAEACRALDFPVVSGNVSLYNETDGVGIPPTPVVGGVGLIEDLSKIATLKGAQPGDALILIGETKGHLGASLYAREILGLEGDDLGPPPPIDLETEKRNADFVRSLIGRGLVNAVHDVSDGGIACAAAEMALASGVGLKLELVERLAPPVMIGRLTETLFFEDQARFLCAVGPKSLDRWSIEGARFARCGSFGGDQLSLGEFSLPLSRLREAHEGWLPRYMAGTA